MAVSYFDVISANFNTSDLTLSIEYKTPRQKYFQPIC